MHRAMNIIGTLELGISLLLQRDPRLLRKLERIDDKEFTSSSHRKRRYLARDLEVLYLEKDIAFGKKYSAELFGYYFATNIGKKELTTILSNACEAAGIPFEIAVRGYDIAKRGA